MSDKNDLNFKKIEKLIFLYLSLILSSFFLSSLKQLLGGFRTIQA